MTDQPPPRFSVSQLPAEVDPEEKSFARLLTQALSPSFVLVKRLGAGGMGAVYLARDPLLRRLVAVKVLAPNLASDPEARARFEREGQAVAAISHPNVVAVHSVGELENGVPYIVMQYIEGRTMADRLKEDGPLDARSAKHVIGEVASALAAAHKKGIIHRDIKPANILLDEDTGRAMVTDFGIAAVKQRGEEKPAVEADLTQAGHTVGTPAYMSPEQVLAEPITEKTDIYSLGLLAYQLFIADGPYQISSPKEIMVAHVRDTPRPLHTMRGDVEPELERLIESCLSKDPNQRPSAAEVEKRLQHGASILLEWPPPGLEPLRGELQTVLRFVLWGALGAGISIAVLSLFDRASFVRQSLPPGLFTHFLAVIGTLVFLVGLAGLARFFSRGKMAVAVGYGWGTIFEWVADERGDTGALIAGAREYAELSPRTRNAMRRYRMLALVFRILACITPSVGYVLGVLFGARSPNGPTIVLWASILSSFTLLAAARIVRAVEDRAMREPRRRLRSASGRVGAADQIAQAWVESFEQVRAGQTMGGGPRARGRGTTVAAATAIGLTMGAATLLVVTLLLTAIVSIAGSVAVPKFSNTTNRIVRLQRLREYAASPDTSITPLRAGQALHAISRNGPGGALQAYEREPTISIPPQRAITLPDPFPGSDGGWITHAFLIARRGFTPQQRDYLRAVADNSGLQEFRTIGRASAMDLAGAYWDLSTDARWIDLPIPKFNPVKAAAQANMAQAALDLAAGRSQEAEQRLRENLRVGFLMMDEAHTLIESLIGAVIVGTTRTAMAAYYEAVGKARDARYVSQQSDPDIVIRDMDFRSFTLDDVHNMTRRMVLDTAEIRALRWELLMTTVAVEPCTDMYQVIFGPDSIYRATLAQARRDLVRRPSDSAFFALVQVKQVKPVTAGGSRGRAMNMTRPVSKTISALTGNRQLEACLSLFGGY